MPRQPRQCPAGHVYHIWNRAAGRLRLFRKHADYAAFEQVMILAHQRHPIRLLEWCLMPNHWHFVVWPTQDDQVSAFFRWLTHTHAMRSIAHRRMPGTGPMYQSRFKSMPVRRDEHLSTLLRYVQRNPVRARLVQRADQWQHGGLWARRHASDPLHELLTPWPIDPRPDWDDCVNQEQTPAELESLREHIRRGRPYGPPQWTRTIVTNLGLQSTMRPRGRPRNTAEQEKELRPL